MKPVPIPPSHSFNGVDIPHRPGDGYLNATAMCQSNGKLFGHYMETGPTKEFLEALSADIALPISELVQVRKGGKPHLQGTWVHPDVAVHLAQWLSPKFAVQVAKWVRELLTTGTVTVKPTARQKRYELEGRSAEFAVARLEGIPARRTFTDALKEHGVEGPGYPDCTNAIYTHLFGGTAKQIREARQIPPKAELRDGLSAIEVAELRLTELWTAEQLAATDAAGNDECEAVCEHVGESVAAVRKRLLANAVPSLN